MTRNKQKTIGLSKTKVLAWFQCPKRLYLAVNHPELAETDETLEYRFAEGQAVGQVARKLQPGGVLIGNDESPPLALALKQTRELLDGPGFSPLFEATFEHDKVLIRADIIIPQETGLVLREVKSSASVKQHHLPDCAVQAWVMAQAGYPPERVELSHVDTSFVYEKPGHYDGLLVHKDITEEVAVYQDLVTNWVEGAHQTLAGEMPDIEPGMQCSEPFDCPFMSHCWKGVPEYPVTILPNGGKIIDELLARGTEDIRDIAEGVLTKPLHRRVRDASISGKAFIDPEAGATLRKLPYPRYYLDFETIGFAVPIWLNTRPYESLPFQWSCHIERQPGEIEHTAFLDISGEPPMRAFAEKLLSTLGKEGPIFMYSPYERRIIKEQARRFPDLEDELFALIDRLYDLQNIAKKYYYHPAMKGKWSIKNVLPTIAPELDYGQLDEVQNGTEAQIAYVECIAAETSDERRKELEEKLHCYCEMDTLAMVKIAHFFEER